MSTVKQLKEVPGLMTCVLEHEVKSTKATFAWNGPKISPECWRQVLAFFKWTYNEHKSESQVRLYVNLRTGHWAAWAFPQEARTGMSAKELDTEQTRLQRAMFSDGEGWLYFGTVHHHCSAGAFQSGTDRSNEENQDGLHITIGNMDKPMHDMHCRLYVSKQEFNPKMNWFWDVEPTLGTLPSDLRMFLAEGVEDRLARQQMCVAAPAGTEFPQQWKDNVIEIKQPVSQWQGSSGLGWERGSSSGPFKYNYFRSHKTCPNTERDLFIARKEILDFFSDPKSDLAVVGGIKDPIDALKCLADCPLIVELMENFYRNDVHIESVVDYMIEQEQAELNQEVKETEDDKNGKGKKKGKKNKGGNQENGIPDYQGGNDYDGGLGYGAWGH